jgi:hypothetical protein
MRTVVLIPLVLQGALVAQDVFNAGGEAGDCNQLKASERQVYSSHMQALDAKEKDNRRQYERDLDACSTKSCKTDAMERQEHRMEQLRLEAIDEETRHEKANREIDTRCTLPVAFGRTTCLHERALEARRYALQMMELEKKGLDIANKFKRAMVTCHLDGSCKDNAHYAGDAAGKELAKEREAENQRHSKALAALDRGVCGETNTARNGRESKSSTQPVRSPRPTPTVYSVDDPGFCCGEPFDVRKPVDGADPKLNFTLGFERGFADCLEKSATNPVSLCMVVTAMVAAKFKNAVLAAGLVGTGRVMALQALMEEMQKDIDNSQDPFATGIEYGRRGCVWFGAAASVMPGGKNTGANSKPKPKLDPKRGTCSIEPEPLVPKSQAVDPSKANDWLPAMNPSGCTTNCGLVAAAVENALAGKGIVPAPGMKAVKASSPNAMNTPVALLESVFGGKFGNKMLSGQVAQFMNGLPEGSRGILFASWGAAAGHFLNIVKFNNQLWLLDGQVGRLVSFSEYPVGANFQILRTK